MFGVEKFGDRNSTLQLFHVREERCSPNVAPPKGKIVCSLTTKTNSHFTDEIRLQLN